MDTYPESMWASFFERGDGPRSLLLNILFIFILTFSVVSDGPYAHFIVIISFVKRERVFYENFTYSFHDHDSKRGK